MLTPVIPVTVYTFNLIRHIHGRCAVSNQAGTANKNGCNVECLVTLSSVCMYTYMTTMMETTTTMITHDGQSRHKNAYFILFFCIIDLCVGYCSKGLFIICIKTILSFERIKQSNIVTQAISRIRISLIR